MKLSLSTKTPDQGDSLWMRCESCSAIVYKKVVEERHHACPECGFHFRISVEQRIALLLDEGTWKESHSNIESGDPLKFKAKKSYREKYDRARKATGHNDAAVIGTGDIHGVTVSFCIIDPNFIMGSMGSVVGEKIALAAEYAHDHRLPLVIVSGSGGGARMEEGLLSLFQMAKTSAAIRRLQDAGGIYITVLTNATMGGSMASWASLGDIIIAEPQALLGFAGPRVIAQTVRQELPAGFQTSEFLLEHGFIDQICVRSELRDRLAKLLRYTVKTQPAVATKKQTKRITKSSLDGDTDVLTPASVSADTGRVAR
jgi:acetyl-CoA carboxylase carboxyl transferase subunit beta